MRSAFFLFLFSALASQDLHAQAAGMGRTGGTGNQLFPNNAKTSTYQTIPSDFQFCKTIPVASGTFTITLVASTTQPKNGTCIRILNFGSGTVTVARSGQNINTVAANQVIQPGSAQNPSGLWITSDGTDYNAQPLGAAAPSSLFSCQILDNSICTSAVDASGNPNFLATAAGVVLPINGGTTPLVMFIGGVYQVLNSNVTLTVPSTASVQQWILAKQDTTNASMVAADFLAMNTAPFYQYTAPTCPSPGTALSATNPSFWYDLSTNLSKLCTTNAGSYTASASMVIGTIFVDATPKVLQVLTEPYRLNPYNRFMQFGSGADGVLTITSGTTTIDTHKQYQSVLMTAGTLTHSVLSATTTVSIGVSFQSQNPVMVIGTGVITGTGLGRPSVTGTTGAGAVGNSAGLGGSGGGGGGSGTVSAAGGAGGGRAVWLIPSLSSQGGTGGAATPTAGSNGASAATDLPPPLLINAYGCSGASGGTGAGDATNAGGSSGAGGGSIFIKGPAILAISTVSVTSNGNNGSTGAGGNAAGGGGGGGGCIVLNGGYLSTAAATITTTGGTGGTKAGAGSGTAGGNGGAGMIQQNKLW